MDINKSQTLPKDSRKVARRLHKGAPRGFLLHILAELSETSATIAGKFNKIAETFYENLSSVKIKNNYILHFHLLNYIKGFTGINYHFCILLQK